VITQSLLALLATTNFVGFAPLTKAGTTIVRSAYSVRSTRTPTPTATRQSVKAKATPTRSFTPSRTPRATRTPTRPPTSTPTPTATRIRTFTPTPTNTFTFPPTATRTATPTQAVKVAAEFVPYWVEDSLARVQPRSPRGVTATASISAAQNEYEAFQIIVRAPDGADLVDVNGYATDLTGPGGTLPSANVMLYREHYVQVSTSSPGSPYPPGHWPDALIPFLNPETGQPLSGGRFPAAPFDVTMGSNQPLYVEVYVPAGTAPGVYSGSVVLSAAGHTDTMVPVTLQVRNFALPERASLRSSFTPYRETSNVVTSLGITWGSSEQRSAEEKFNEILLAHRLSPDAPSGTAPYIDTATGHMYTGSSHPVLHHYFEELKTTGWAIPFGGSWPWSDPVGADRSKVVTYLTEMADYLSANGWFSRSYIYLYDEPNSAAGYAAIRDVAALIHSVRADYRVLVTVQPQPTDPTWGSLLGAVDIWVPLFPRFEETISSSVMAMGNEVWGYTESGAQPAWLIDQPLLNERVTPWIEWRYGQTGLLYWTPWYWEETNPWDSAATYTVPWGTYNGNGSLVYPGNDVGYENGPVASMRLKALRDGMEDYEYLQLLNDLGDASTAAAEALGIGTSWKSWNNNPLDLEAARRRLGTQIETLRSSP